MNGYKGELQGFIMFYRSILSWEWWHDINVFRLFSYLLLAANFTENQFEGITVKRGQIVTSLPSLQKATDLTVQNVRTALKKLKSTGEITDKVTNKYRLITIVNYDNYQGNGVNDNSQTNRQLTGNQQTTNRQLTPTKEYKNDKNIRSSCIEPTFAEIEAYAKKKKSVLSAKEFYDQYKGRWDKVKDWKACFNGWDKNKRKQPTDYDNDF